MLKKIKNTGKSRCFFTSDFLSSVYFIYDSQNNKSPETKSTTKKPANTGFFQQNKHYLTNKIKSRLLPAFYTFILSVFQPNQTTGYGLQSSMLYTLPHHDVPIFLQKHPILWIFSFQYHEPFAHQLF